MEIWIAGLALVFVFLYFIVEGRRQHQTWKNFRQRQRQRIQNSPPVQPPIDPDFQFDQPAEKDRPDLNG